MKELLLLLKDMCETETPVTLKSLLNSLEMIDEFDQVHIVDNLQQYGTIGYLNKEYHGLSITFLKCSLDYDGTEYDSSDSDDAAIYIVPYKDNQRYREVNYNDQVLIVGIETKNLSSYDQEFLVLTQNNKYVKDNFVAKDKAEISEFINILMHTLEVYN